jgi:hypothetical protein
MSKTGGGSLRGAMPGIAAWLDELRTVFGRAEIDEQIRGGLRGECVFYAQENGHQLGKKGPPGVPLSPPPLRIGKG